MKLSHFFLPHPQTHEKAHLLSWKAFLIYIFLFLLLDFGLSTYSKISPGVLGISSSLNPQQVIELVNQERAKNNLLPLTENKELNLAAYKKAQNMFEENYWAHYSPSGKDPWGFITGAGYKFTYAGENLAKNFYSPSDVVVAWMASPTHRDNILNNHYQDIGIAVTEGVLQGQKTTLIVQEFGKPAQSISEIIPQQKSFGQSNLSIDKQPSPSTIPLPAPLVAGERLSQWATDPFLIIKSLSLVVIFVLAVLLLIDAYILKKRAVLRVTANHFPHMAFISVAAAALLSMQPGSII